MMTRRTIRFKTLFGAHYLTTVSLAAALLLTAAGWRNNVFPATPGKACQDKVKDDSGDGEKARVLPTMGDWEKLVKERIAKDRELRLLAARYRLVLLQSWAFGASGATRQSRYSFVDETADRHKYRTVQIFFQDTERKENLYANVAINQQNLLADLGLVDFTKDPDPKKVDLDGEGLNSWDPICRAREGHVYLERIRDSDGNNFYVLFKLIAVERQNRFIAFLWRRLPGGKVNVRRIPIG